MTSISRSLRALILQRALNRCEYCQINDVHDATVHEVEHIVPRKHGGLTEPQNLALGCLTCNRCKGPNISGLDPSTGLLTRLFNPRADRWREHFQWQGASLLGRTDVGRTTIVVLQINRYDRIDLRKSLIAEGAFPPK